MDTENCDICGRHLDALRADLTQALAADAAAGFVRSTNELAELLLLRIAPRMHAAVEEAKELGEGIARMVVPKEML